MMRQNLSRQAATYKSTFHFSMRTQHNCNGLNSFRGARFTSMSQRSTQNNPKTIFSTFKSSPRNGHNSATSQISRFRLQAVPISTNVVQQIYNVHALMISKEDALKELLQQLEEDRQKAILACSMTHHDSSRFRNVLSSIARATRTLLSTIRDFFMILLRGAEIGAIVFPIVVLAHLTSACFSIDRLLGQTLIGKTFEDFTWWYTLYAVQMLGPAFVKLSQWCATRRDIFPPYIYEKLATLHTSNWIHSWEHTEHLLTESFGKDWADELLVEPQNVIGSGTIAQVYKGELRKGSKPVAVKVLHPRIEELVERDLIFIRRMAVLLDSMPLHSIKVLGLPRAVDSFEDILRRQVDLRVEGENLTQFYRNFDVDGNNGKSPTVGVAFPKPVPGWVSHDVLVEDLITSEEEIENSSLRSYTTSTTVVPISAFLADESEEGLKLRKKLAKPLLSAFLQMVFGHNFVHCDLHPGNVLVKSTTTTSGGSKGKTKFTIVFLDAGITASLSPQGQRNLKDLFRAVVFNEGEKAGRLMVERARSEKCSQVEGGVEAFSKGISEIVSEFHDNRKKGLTLGAVRIGNLLGRVLDLCRIHGVELDPSMASIVLSTVILEGLGRSLEPDLNLIDFAMPFLVGRGFPERRKTRT